MTVVEDNADGLRRRLREEEQATLFGDDLAPVDWKAHWWGMPSFEHGDARPAYAITVNFMTAEDVAEFAKRLGVRVSTRSDTMWYPPETIDKPSDWEYVD